MFSENGMILKKRYDINMITPERLQRDFFVRDVLQVAPDLIGKTLAVRSGKDSIIKSRITETEAYRGTEDKACHASKGRTARTDVMYHEGGKIYVYFVYGMYWMLNIVAGGMDDPQAALIRGIEGLDGPGKLTRAIGIDKSFYGEDLVFSQRIWIEDNGISPKFKIGPRIGIDYAGDPWKDNPWRFYIEH